MRQFIASSVLILCALIASSTVAVGATIVGGSGDNVFDNPPGDDDVDGGQGSDTLNVTQFPSAYVLEGAVLVNPVDGRDSLTSIERIGFFKFLDPIFHLDVSLEDLRDPDGDGDGVSPVVAILQRISDLYVAFFGRTPDTQGFAYWLGEVYRGRLDLAQVAQSFTEQPEYAAAYPPGLADREFIRRVYQNLLDREPDTAGWDYWEDELQSGRIPRNVFLLAVINGALAPTGGAEDGQLVSNKREVALFYSEALVRNSLSLDEGIDALLRLVTSAAESVATAKETIQQATDAQAPFLDFLNPVVDGIEWLRMEKTNGGNRWNDVAAVCDPGTGACTGIYRGVDLTGWVWADIDEVMGMFERLSGLPEGSLADRGEAMDNGSPFAPAVINALGATLQDVNTGAEFIYGLTRTTVSAASIDEPLGGAPYVLDFPSDPDDEARDDLIQWQSFRASSSASGGVYLYRQVSR